MSTTSITWSDGSTSTVTYTGQGNATVSIGHTANTGVDRSATATISTTVGGVSGTVTLFQYGKSEYMVSSDNKQMSGSDGVLTLEKSTYDVAGASAADSASLGYSTAEINAILNKIDQWES